MGKKDKGSKGHDRGPEKGHHSKKAQRESQPYADADLRKALAELNEQLAPQHLVVRNVPGDGNCMFYSVERHVEGDGIDARQIACKYMEEHPDDFAPFVDLDEYNSFGNYIDAMRKNCEWGGNLELRALACALHVHIVVHTAKAMPLQISCPKPKAVVHLGYLMGDHYGCVEYLTVEARDAWCKRLLKQKDAASSDENSASSDGEDFVFRMANLRTGDASGSLANEGSRKAQSHKKTKHEKRLAKKDEKIGKGRGKASSKDKEGEVVTAATLGKPVMVEVLQV